jgi:4a-hydroxytetrahydrobiopterin dehydratase
MTDELADRKCRPCEGGIDKLDAEAVTQLMGALHDDWTHNAESTAIERLFEFPSFARTIAFTNVVAWVATVEGHHPEMIVNYGSCKVVFWTHAIDGLSDNDFICAAKIDRLATN